MKNTTSLPSRNECRTLLSAFGAVTSLLPPLHAASTLTDGTTTKISGNTAFYISVYDGKAGYAGAGTFSGTTGIFGDGTVSDYMFIKNGAATPTLVRYADGAANIIGATTNNTFTTFADLDRGDVWTTSDPGTNFSGGAAADYAGTTETISGGYLVSGTIDISNLFSGTIYLLCGGYDTIFQTGLTMKGSGQSNLLAASGDIDPTADRNMYVISYTFDNTSGFYDTIDYNYTGSAANRSRFMGVVIDAIAVPEPDAALLGAVGLLLLLRRRR